MYKWLKNRNRDPDMLPDAKTSAKMRTLIRPMAMGIGRQVLWDSPSFPGEAAGWAAPASKSWKPVLHYILRCLAETFTDAWILLMLPLNPLETASWCPDRGVLQHFWEVSGQLWKSESMFQDVMNITDWDCGTRLGVWHQARWGQLLKDVILGRVGTILSRGLFHLPSWCLPCSHSGGHFYLVITGF